MATGRSRGLRKQLSSEDSALNMIAKEAEARLAAKRAARAEARSIRMKELERKQREIDELETDEIDMPPRRSPSSRISSPATSSPSGSETNLSGITVDSMKDTLKETEEKYRKAMVNAAQLDNERQALLYQVECLKDIIENLEESLHNVKDELQDKIREHTKITRENEKTSERLNKCNLHLQERERILDEHGINLDGTLKENDADDVDGVEPTYPNMSYSNHIAESSQHNEERESLLSEIDSLKNEIAELKSQQESNGSRKSAENTRMAERGDLERSFVDVSTEAAAIREESRHTAMYVNNNEKCDEFEVIDDGSQQGGMRHFEDKSFEKSGRSSLLSSMMTTDGVLDSMESEVPLEISIDKSQTNREEYDIVQMDEPKSKPTTLDISSLTARGERVPSPVTQSNININKYLFSDNDEDEIDEPVSSGTFNIDMYFCAEETTEGDAEKIQPEEEMSVSEQSNSQETAKDTDEQSTTEKKKEGSPFVEVESQVSDPIVIAPINDTKSSDTPAADVTENSKASDETSSPVEVSIETLGENNDLNQGFAADDVETVDGAGQSVPTATESGLLSDLEKKRPNVISSGKFTENTPMLVSDNRMSMTEVDTEIRKSVEDLYEQIAGETGENNGKIDTIDLNQQLPKDATFGVFSITGTSDMSRDEDDSTSVREITSKMGSTDSATEKKSEKWLVRVESFSMPSKKKPEIKVIETEKNHVVENASIEAPSNEATPVPKERKKKKKKKKGKAVKEHSVERQSSADDLDTPSPPDSKQDSETSTPAVSPSKRIDHSDIPKQFLDASTHLAGGDSISDTSDVEHEEYAEDGSTISKKRGGSKKGELQRQIQEQKSQVAKLEQENGRLEGQVIRLESQVKRYKNQAESAVATEDGLLADKRKIGRELRQCQDQILQLETENEQLHKRLDKLKNRIKY